MFAAALPPPIEFARKISPDQRLIIEADDRLANLLRVYESPEYAASLAQTIRLVDPDPQGLDAVERILAQNPQLALRTPADRHVIPEPPLRVEMTHATVVLWLYRGANPAEAPDGLRDAETVAYLATEGVELELRLMDGRFPLIDGGLDPYRRQVIAELHRLDAEQAQREAAQAQREAAQAQRVAAKQAHQARREEQQRTRHATLGIVETPDSEWTAEQRRELDEAVRNLQGARERVTVCRRELAVAQTPEAIRKRDSIIEVLRAELARFNELCRLLPTGSPKGQEKEVCRVAKELGLGARTGIRDVRKKLNHNQQEVAEKITAIEGVTTAAEQALAEARRGLDARKTVLQRLVDAHRAAGMLMPRSE